MRCPNCNAVMVEDDLEIEDIDYPAWYCEECGNIIRREE